MVVLQEQLIFNQYMTVTIELQWLMQQKDLFTKFRGTSVYLKSDPFWKSLLLLYNKHIGLVETIKSF